MEGRPISRQRHQRRQLAALVRGQLAQWEVDCAPLAELATTLRTTWPTVRQAVTGEPDLGLCGDRRHRIVWGLPPEPITAGFAPVPAGNRLLLRLPSEGLVPPLTISGTHLGLAIQRDPDVEDLDVAAPGELGYAVVRHANLARQWLRPGHNVFALIARAWRTSPCHSHSTAQLWLHRVEFGEPIATEFWPHHSTTQLELAVWDDPQHGATLCNAYPSYRIDN